MPTIEKARQWYQDVDAVHNFGHIQRVYNTAVRLAVEENADLEIVKAAALLHDAVGTTPGAEERSDHHLASAEFASGVLAGEGWIRSASGLFSTASVPTASGMTANPRTPLRPK